MSVSIYLVGAIRGGLIGTENDLAAVKYDVEWRNYASRKIVNNLNYTGIEYARVLNPCYGKTFDPVAGKWYMYEKFNAFRDNVILQPDLAKVRKADILLCNLLPFEKQEINDCCGMVPAEQNGYPMVGSFCEIGAGLALNKLMVVVHNSARLKMHPFINNATATFDNIEDAVEFTIGLTESLAGWNAEATGYPQILPYKDVA